MLDFYIDADACPVKELAFQVAKRYGLTVYAVSNTPIVLPKAEWIIPHVVEKSFDAVDNWIESKIERFDLCLTNDTLLAEKCIRKGALAITPRGMILDENTIGDALAIRELKYDLRQQGARDLGPKPTGKSHRSQFLSSLDSVINRLRKQAK